MTLQRPSNSNKKNNEVKYTLLLKTGILTIDNFIIQADATNIDKNAIKNFVTQLVAQELVIKKTTSQGNESYHKTTEKDLLQPPKHCTRTPTKTNFNKTSEVESETQTDFIYNIYVKNEFLKLFTKIIWNIKGMLTTFLTH